MYVCLYISIPVNFHGLDHVCVHPCRAGDRVLLPADHDQAPGLQVYSPAHYCMKVLPHSLTRACRGFLFLGGD